MRAIQLLTVSLLYSTEQYRTTVVTTSSLHILFHLFCVSLSFFVFLPACMSVFTSLSDFLQPSLCGEDLCETIFHELEDILQPSSKKKILLFTDSVFEIQEFAFLKQQLDQRWILDSSRMIPVIVMDCGREAVC